MSLIDVKVPDIGDFKNIPVIEILVKPGDVVKPEDALVSLESDKATMDVPSPAAGKVAEIVVAIGDKVSQGTLILKLEGAGDGAAASGEAMAASASAASGGARSASSAPRRRPRAA